MAQRQANPADKVNKQSIDELRRIPAGAPALSLAVPEIPGYHLHWFAGRNIQKALQGWYEFVDVTEVQLMPDRDSLGSDLTYGNTDLGTRVSKASKDFDENNQPERLYLMKIKEELFQADQKAMTGPESRLGNLHHSLKSGQIGMEGKSNADRQSVYVGNRSFLQNDPLSRIFNKE